MITVVRAGKSMTGEGRAGGRYGEIEKERKAERVQERGEAVEKELWRIFIQ